MAALATPSPSVKDREETWDTIWYAAKESVPVPATILAMIKKPIRRHAASSTEPEPTVLRLERVMRSNLGNSR